MGERKKDMADGKLFFFFDGHEQFLHCLVVFFFSFKLEMKNKKMKMVGVLTQNGDTALHIAAAMGRRKLTRILLAAGCSTHVKNKVKSTQKQQRLRPVFL